MSAEFKREERYIVFKLSGVEEHFTPGEKQQLARLAEVQRVDWEETGKPPLECVVVESDWLEYEPTWRAIEARITGAQPAPSVPEGWLHAIDEALVVTHIGVANADDTYEQAKAKLDNLIGFHVDVATDPAVNGGWKLVPTAESRHPGIYKMLGALHAIDNTRGASEWESYAAMLAAAPKMEEQ